MIVSIDKSHPIFNSVEYQKDVVPFSLLEFIKHSPMLLISDEKSYIVGMVAPQAPIWIWTADDISDAVLSELSNYFYDKFSTGNCVHFVAKPEVAILLAKRFVCDKNADTQCVKMESFECPTLIPAKNTAVTPERPSIVDIDEIAVCANDLVGKVLSREESIKEAENFISNPKSFVIKQNGNVVAMACSARETEKYIAINHVYTLPEYRGQGFAAALVAHICKLIMDCGKIPLLYTDLSNPSSNKAYKNVGFVERGKVDEITLRWD